MRFISTKVHGVMDYLVGFLLISFPFTLGFYEGGAESYIPIMLGLITLGYSICTRYEMGLIKALPMTMHLGLDLIAGVFLAASPWIFGFDQQVSVPHVLVGLFEVCASLTTRTHPAWEVLPFPR